MQEALAYHNFDVAGLLIGWGADIDNRNTNGETAVFRAIKEGDYEVIFEYFIFLFLLINSTIGFKMAFRTRC